MAAITDIVEGKDLSRIKRLNLFARQVVEGYCTGLHQSPHKGFSVEFKQHRPYTHGDEIKRIDWKVFGRSDRHYIREYEEETNLRCTLIVDAFGSMGYVGNSGQVKFEYAKRLSACLAYLMMGQGDSVGLVTFDDQVRSFIPDRQKTSHLQYVIETLEQTRLGDETGLMPVVRSLVPRLRRRGLVVLISDCFGDVGQLIKSLAQLRNRGHEILIFQIWDRDELDFPFKQWTKFVDLEVVGENHMVDPASLRKSYLANLEKFREELRRGCLRNRVDLIPLVTDEPYAAALAKYLAARMR